MAKEVAWHNNTTPVLYKGGYTRPRVDVPMQMAEILMNPNVDLSDWDDEELEHGFRRSSSNNWRGRPPRVIPRQCYQELTKRTLSQANEILRKNMAKGVQVLVDFALDPDLKPSDRIRCIDMMMERVMGKPKETIDLNVTQDPPWLEAIRDALVIDATSHEVEEDDYVFED